MRDRVMGRQKWQDRFDARRQAQAALVQEADALCQRLGVPGRAHYDGVVNRGYTREVVITFEAADRLARELGR